MTEPAFIEDEEHYKDFCDNANDLMQSVNNDGGFRWVNRSWLKAMGYTADQVSYMTIWDIIHPDELAHCRRLFGRVISGEDVGRITTIFLTKGGDRVFVEGEVNCEFEGDKPLYTRAIFRDITARRRLEKERERLILELKKALDEVKTLSGLIPICAWCKKVRNEEGYWQAVEQYIQQHSGAAFTHSICQECYRKYFGGCVDEENK